MGKILHKIIGGGMLFIVLSIFAFNTTVIAENDSDIEQYLKYEVNSDNTITVTGYDKNVSDKGVIIIPDTINGYKVASIGNLAFRGCDGLVEIHIPNGVKYIGESAFSNCKSLKIINIPPSLEKIDCTAFIGSYLEKVEISDLGKWCQIEFVGALANPVAFADLYLNGEKLTHIEIPEGITEIKQHTFGTVNSLVEVTLSSSVKIIDDYAFGQCTNLVKVNLQEGLVSIGESAFENCENLEFIKLPNSLLQIGRAAFARCYQLKSISIPQNVTVLEPYLFVECSKLEEVEIGENVTEIKDSVFNDCTSLKRVIIPESVVEIGDFVFSNCKGLKEVLIPQNVISIGENAFWKCSSDLVLKVERLSDAAVYAAMNGIKYEYICKHSYSEELKIYKEPTCEDEGRASRYCTICGEFDELNSMTVPANGHIENEMVAIAPTCDKEGLTKGVDCITCGKILVEQEIIPTTEHIWEMEYTIDEETSCSKEGIKSIHCSNCDAKKDPISIPTINHQFMEEWHRNDEEHWKKCYYCDASTSREKHAFIWNLQDESIYFKCCSICESIIDIGYHSKTIKICESELLKFQFDDKTNIVIETEDESVVSCELVSAKYVSGYKENPLELVYECIVRVTGLEAGKVAIKISEDSGAEVAKYYIEVTGHTEVTDEAVPPTCTSTGLTTGSHCSVCNKILTAQESIPVLNHVWDEGTITKESTCTSEGIRTFTCKLCSDTYTDKIAVLAHEYPEKWYSDESVHWQECICGEKSESKDHEFEWVLDKEATEDTVGEKHEECTVCGYLQSEGTVIDKLPHVHDMQYKEGTEVTCEEAGSKEYYVCLKCKKMYSDSTGSIEIKDIEIQALGHDWGEGTITTEPTCTTLGVKTFECTRCDKTKTEDVGMTEHIYSQEWTSNESSHWHECSCGKKAEDTEHVFEWIIDKEATEDTVGVKHEECIVCNYKQNEFTIIDKLPHTHEMKKTEAKAATCKEEGNIEYYTCTKCDKVYSDETGNLEIKLEDTIIPVIDHNWGEGKVTVEPTCVEAGVKTYTCVACGSEKEEELTVVAHEFRGEWYHDEISHWQLCECGEKSESEDHNFEWVIDQEPTEEAVGEKHEECTVCQKRQNEGTVIDKLQKPVEPGDVNGDGSLDTSDAQLIFNIFMGITSADDEEVLELADVNNDGSVDTSDAQMVFNMFMGII